MARLTFLGAAQTVTGSQYLLEAGERARSWSTAGCSRATRRCASGTGRSPAFDPRSVSPLDPDPHAPRPHRARAAAREAGLPGHDLVHAAPRSELAEVLLLDAAHLQQEDADYLNRKGLTKHEPALPLFDERGRAGVAHALPRRAPRADPRAEPVLHLHVPRRRPPAGRGLRGRARPRERPGDARAVQRRRGPLRQRAREGPRARPDADYLVVESTYGNRAHPADLVQDQLEGVLQRTFARGGVLLIPAFAVGRAQQMIFLMDELVARGRLRPFPIHLDSPMAIDATRIYAQYPEARTGQPERRRGAQPALRQVGAPAPHARGVGGPEHDEGPGGHHLLERHALGRAHPAPLPRPPAPRPRTRSSSPATRRRARSAARSLDGARVVRIHKGEVPVLAEIASLKGLSGPRGRRARWCAGSPRSTAPPQASS